MENEINKKDVSEISSIYKDLSVGDPYALKTFQDKGYDVEKLKKALTYLTKTEDISPEEKANLLQESWRIEYKVKPPTPEEFLTEKYLGPTAGTIYPHVRETIKKFLDPVAPYRTLILYPAISWGKSFCSTITTLYISTCVSMMRNPWKHWGLSPATQISQFLLSYSLKKSSELLLEPYMGVLEASPFFIKERTVAGMKEKEDEFRETGNIDHLYYTTAYPTSALGFASGLTIKLASNPGALLGTTILSIVMSELAFFKLAGKTSEYTKGIFDKAVARVNSRMHGDYWGRVILDTSPDSLENAIDDYALNIAPTKKDHMIVKGADWEWKKELYADDFETGNTFKVYLGGKGNPPRLLEDDDPLLQDSAAVDPGKIITVPGQLKEEFKENLIEAIKDRAGIPSGTADTLIYDYKPLEAMFDNHLKNMYADIHAPANENPQNLIWNQIAPIFFKNKAGNYEFYYKPKVPRCVSVDQSYATDTTAISMAHLERFYDTGELIYVIDFSIVITATKDANINLEAVHCFINDLRNKGHLNIEYVSFDQFQSETTIQNLKREGFEVEKLSVDTSIDPYMNFVSLINRYRVVAGKNIFLKNNLKSIHLTREKTKTGKPRVDHDNSRAPVITGSIDWESSPVGQFNKDSSDSACAAMELCRRYFISSDETWTGGPKSEESNSVADKKEAKQRTSALLKKMGF